MFELLIRILRRCNDIYNAVLHLGNFGTVAKDVADIKAKQLEQDTLLKDIVATEKAIAVSVAAIVVAVTPPVIGTIASQKIVFGAVNQQ
jgi:hypothetical protein